MSVTTYAKTIFWDFLSLIYPNVCLGCTKTLLKGEELICMECRVNLPKANYHRYQENPLFVRVSTNNRVRSATAFLKFQKRGIVQKLLHALKYKGRSDLGIRLGTWYGHELNTVKPQIDYIIPVPLHHLKEKKRGYNQAQKIALGLSSSLNIPILEDAIVRSRNTNSQTRKSKVERVQNVEGIYESIKDDSIQNKSLLLVDDVITTGATTGSLIDLLSEKGAKEIHIACLATGI